MRCDFELTQEDCVSARQFEDQIGCFGFIDHPHERVRQAGAYGIPYRALVPRGVDNLLIAGRMMTVELVAHNSTRNTVCCLVCGQAAGTAAALRKSPISHSHQRGEPDVVIQMQRRMLVNAPAARAPR